MLIVYAATAARSLYWGDGAELVAVAQTLGIAHPPGYPLYTLLGSLAVRVPVGSPFFRLSLMSAVFGAAACGVLVLLARELIGIAIAGAPGRMGERTGGALETFAAAATAVAGLLLGFSPVFWSQATVPEVYTLSAFLVLSMLLLVVWWRRSGEDAGAPGPGCPQVLGGDRSLLVAGLVLGLAISHHLTAVLLLPGVAILIFAAPGRRPSARALAGTVGLAVAGLTPYLYLMLRAGHDPAILWAETGTAAGLLNHIVGAQYASRLFASPWLQVVRRLGVLARDLPVALPWVALVCGATGLWLLWRRSRTFALAFAVALAAVVFHAASYRIPDIEPYGIPAVAIISALAAVGVGAALGVRRRAAAIASCVVLLVVLSVALVRQVVGDWVERDLSGYRDGARYAGRLLEELPEGAIVLAQEDATIFPLWYVLFAEGSRRDVAVLDVRGKSPHLSRWHTSVRFPTEAELAAFFGTAEAPPCDPPGRELLPIGRYLPLLADMNSDRPVFADHAVARSRFRGRAVPVGLLSRIVPTGAEAADTLDLLTEGPWAEYLADLDDAAPTTRASYGRALADVGRLYLADGRIEEGTLVLERARDVAPGNAQTHNNLGVAYYKLDRQQAATEEFERALELDPGLAGAHHNIAEAYAKAGDLDRAQAELEAAAALEPRSVRYRVELGTLYERSGDFDRAERMFAEAERIAPNEWMGAMAHGDFLVRMQRYSEAVAAYRRAERLNPAAAGVQRGIGRCYWAMDELERAIEAMGRSVELQPQNPRLKYDLAMMMSGVGRADEAIDLLTEVIRLMPNSWDTRAARGRLLGAVGRHGEARRDFAHAERLGAKGVVFWNSWSALELAAGDTMRARELESRARGLPAFALSLE